MKENGQKNNRAHGVKTAFAAVKFATKSTSPADRTAEPNLAGIRAWTVATSKASTTRREFILHQRQLCGHKTDWTMLDIYIYSNK